MHSIQVTIVGLPFSSESYERAKSILKAKYRKPPEVANTHTQNVMGLVSTKEKAKEFKSKAPEIMSKGKVPLCKLV